SKRSVVTHNPLKLIPTSNVWSMASECGIICSQTTPGAPPPDVLHAYSDVVALRSLDVKMIGFIKRSRRDPNLGPAMGTTKAMSMARHFFEDEKLINFKEVQIVVKRSEHECGTLISRACRCAKHCNQFGRSADSPV
ncbi:hypothetical protein PMAYCL1PPCAC_09364, partial [Pristionchus mayeri]